jgi:hypothetical protein
MRPIAQLLLAVVSTSFLGGCGEDSPPPADVHGMYTLNVTNGPSTCQLQGWMDGAMTSGIPLTISQNGSSLTADVGGAGAVFLDLYCGNSHFVGTVSGSNIDLALTGTRSLSSGSCAYTIDAHVVGTVQNDKLTGSITYTPNTNTSPDCAAVHTCSAKMNLDGTR